MIGRQFWDDREAKPESANNSSAARLTSDADHTGLDPGQQGGSKRRMRIKAQAFASFCSTSKFQDDRKSYGNAKKHACRKPRSKQR